MRSGSASGLGVVLGISVLFALGVEMIPQAFADEVETEEAREEKEDEEREDGEDTEQVFVPSSVPAPVFSVESGFYQKKFNVALSLPKGCEDGWILYTLDCSEPVYFEGEIVNGDVYDGELTVEEREKSFVKEVTYTAPTVIRAVCVNAQGECSDVVTKTYFCRNELSPSTYGLDFVSIVTDRGNLYDPQYGIFSNPSESGRDWERPATFTYFDREGNEKQVMNIGIRCHGGESRKFDLKSLRMYARDDYDTQKWFEADFFSDSPVPAVVSDETGEAITRFKRLILRNGGNEGSTWGDYVLMRDAFIQALAVGGSNVAAQAYDPVMVYLNGEFYGLMNIRERQDEYYIASHYNCKKEDISIIGFGYEKDGSQTASLYAGAEDGLEFYNQFYEFVKTNDLKDPDNYAKVCEMMDIDNYIDYVAIEVFSGNGDWPGNNCKAWRYNGTPEDGYGLDGKLRFLLYDTDFGMGLYGHSPGNDYLGAAVATGHTEWPNQDGSTLLLRKLFENDEFRNRFVKRYCDRMNTDWSEKNCGELLQRMTDRISPAFALARTKYMWEPLEDSQKKIEEFIGSRHVFAYDEMRIHLSAGNKFTLTLNLEGVEGLDHVDVNSVTGLTPEDERLYRGNWSGAYCSGVETIATAYAKENYRFVRWEPVETLSGSTSALSQIAEDHRQGTLTVTGTEKNKVIAFRPVFEREGGEAPGNDNDGSNGGDDENAQSQPEQLNRFDSQSMLYVEIVAAFLLLAVVAGVVAIGKRSRNGGGRNTEK